MATNVPISLSSQPDRANSSSPSAYTLLVSVLIAIAFLGGCSGEEHPQATNEGISDDSQRTAISKLEDLGARVQLLDDALIEVEGYEVRLFEEHFTKQGLIEDEVFSQLRNVRNCLLILHGTPVTDAGLQRLSEMTGLIGLNLHRTRITDSGIEYLNSLTELRLLKLKRTDFTDSGLQHLRNLTSLFVLYLDQTRISDEGMVHLKGLTRLRALKLSETDVTDSSLAHLAQMKDLRFLGLSYTDITDECLHDILKLSGLEYLDVEATGISGEGIGRIKKALPDCDVKY